MVLVGGAGARGRHRDWSSVSSYDFGAIECFPEGSARVVAAGAMEIGIVRWHGRLYALPNVCPHQRGPLCRGWLLRRVVGSAPGAMDVADDGPVIACPWHGWEFDLQTGRAVSDGRYGVRTFPVRVAHGRVLVDLPGDRVRQGAS